MLGYASAVLAKIYLASGERKYLEGAVRYFDFLMSCQTDVTSFFGFWKVAWAAAVIASILKTEEYLCRATELLDRIVSAQHAEGYWAWSLDLGMSLENDDWLVDLSSEMIVWLCELPRILLTR
jgi:rhamnogalacturonyl hydrolase YesR